MAADATADVDNDDEEEDDNDGIYREIKERR